MLIRYLKWVILRLAHRCGYTIIKKPMQPPTATLAALDQSSPAPEPSSPQVPAEIAGPAVVETVEHRIVAQAKDHLRKALKERDPQQPAYGTRWQPHADRIRGDIDSFLDPVQCLHYAQTRITFDHRESDGYVQDLARIKLYEALVRHEFRHFSAALDAMDDNPLSVPQSLHQVGGRAVSNIFFWHARFVLGGCTYIEPPKRIFEIGGGYGAAARLWMKNPIVPISSFVIVDIPECLFFADVALRHEFGDAVGYFDGTDPGTPIVLVPLPLLASFERPSDLVMNTGSMQEMTDEWIDYYMAWLDRADTRYFYSVNYAAQPLSLLAESRNLWSPRPSAAWSTRRLNLNVPIIRAQGPGNDFAEAYFEKTPAQDSLKAWSVYRGHSLMPETFVEGLDLLRQNLNVGDALAFLQLVLKQMRYVPKELLWIANWLDAQGCIEVKPIQQKLLSQMGGITPTT